MFLISITILINDSKDTPVSFSVDNCGGLLEWVIAEG